MSGPGVYLTFPNSFQLWPEPLPRALPPPVNERSFRSPFGIDKDVYNFVLRPEIPFVFASVYVLLVFAGNAYNRSRGHKTWWISQQRAFTGFVVTHNVLLIIYSAATFLALLRASAHILPSRNDPHYPASLADALCKMHGPRGLGDATAFNSTINIWEAKNTAIKLGYDGNPDPTDVGRLWNEGLAFWGWLFYLSKFYEVLDTVIILAKGKSSVTLQTFHHAGAMLCMWAGIRYMSPPIWMFVFVNSAVHALMYTYFAASELKLNIPSWVKPTLTTMQIAQIIWGASYAAAHLFVAYDIPTSTPYQFVSTVQRAVSSASSAVSTASSNVSSLIASPTASVSVAALLKKLLLRAAGEEGVAERIRHQPHGSIPTPHLPQSVADKIDRFNEQVFETRWRAGWTRVNCLDTSGEAFAIYLNLLYLMPLIWLFVRFYIRKYLRRGRPESATQAAKQVVDAAQEAKDKTEEVVEETGERVADELAKRAEQVRKNTRDLHEQLREDVQKMKEGKFRGERPVSDRVASFERHMKGAAERAKDAAKDAAKTLLNGNSDQLRGSPSKQDVSHEDREPEQPTEGQESGGRQVPANAAAAESEQPNGGEVRQEDSIQKVAKPETESAEKQESNAADSEPSRAGAGAKDGIADDNNANGQSGGTAAPAEVEEKQDVNTKESQPTRPGAEEPKESKPEQEPRNAKNGVDEPNKKDSVDRQQEPTPTGDEPQQSKEEEEDTDAMGKSGALIDFASEKETTSAPGKDEPKAAEKDDQRQHPAADTTPPSSTAPEKPPADTGA